MVVFIDGDGILVVVAEVGLRLQASKPVSWWRHPEKVETRLS